MTSNTNTNAKNDPSQTNQGSPAGQNQGSTASNQGSTSGKNEATSGQQGSNAGQKTDNAGNKVEPMKKDAQGNDVRQTEGAAESTPAKTGSDKR